MTTRKSNNYKLTAVNYYLAEDKTQEKRGYISISLK